MHPCVHHMGLHWLGRACRALVAVGTIVHASASARMLAGDLELANVAACIKESGQIQQAANEVVQLLSNGTHK